METSHNKPRWVIDWKPHCGFWFIIFLPPYHNGRGRYVSIGLGMFRIMRGY